MRKIDIAIISPTLQLRQFSALGDIEMCLSSVATKDKIYTKYYKSRAQQGKFVIVNVGSFEQDEQDKQLHPGKLLETIWEVQPAEIVAPKVLENGLQTLRLIKNFLTILTENGLLHKYSIQAVAQGKTFKEWLHCYKSILNMPAVNIIGIPFDIEFWDLDTESKTKNMMWNRIFIVQLLRDLHEQYPNLPKKPIHLAGLADPFELYIQSLRNGGSVIIRSNDSCIPVDYGADDILFLARQGLPCENIQAKIVFSDNIPKEKFKNIKHNISIINDLKKGRIS